MGWYGTGPKIVSHMVFYGRINYHTPSSVVGYDGDGVVKILSFSLSQCV